MESMKYLGLTTDGLWGCSAGAALRQSMVPTSLPNPLYNSAARASLAGLPAMPLQSQLPKSLGPPTQPPTPMGATATEGASYQTCLYTMHGLEDQKQ